MSIRLKDNSLVTIISLVGSDGRFSGTRRVTFHGIGWSTDITPGSVLTVDIAERLYQAAKKALA